MPIRNQLRSDGRLQMWRWENNVDGIPRSVLYTEEYINISEQRRASLVRAEARRQAANDYIMRHRRGEHDHRGGIKPLAARTEVQRMTALQASYIKAQKARKQKDG